MDTAGNFLSSLVMLTGGSQAWELASVAWLFLAPNNLLSPVSLFSVNFVLPLFYPLVFIAFEFMAFVVAGLWMRGIFFFVPQDRGRADFIWKWQGWTLEWVVCWIESDGICVLGCNSELAWTLACWVAVLGWSHPVDNQCCCFTGPCGSYDCKMPSAITIRKLWTEKKFIIHRFWKAHGIPGSYLVIVGREREGVGLGFCFH